MHFSRSPCPMKISDLSVERLPRVFKQSPSKPEFRDSNSELPELCLLNLDSELPVPESLILSADTYSIFSNI